MSKYKLAKTLNRLRPIMINNYIREVKPCKMSKKTADKFTSLYGIKITDVYNPIKVPE